MGAFSEGRQLLPASAFQDLMDISFGPSCFILNAYPEYVVPKSIAATSMWLGEAVCCFSSNPDTSSSDISSNPEIALDGNSSDSDEKSLDISSNPDILVDI